MKVGYTVAIDSEALDRIRAMRAKWGLPVAEFVRRAIYTALAEYDARGLPMNADGTTGIERAPPEG